MNDLEKIAALVADMKERGVTVEAEIAETEGKLKLLRGLKQMTAAPKEASKPRASRKAAATSGAGDKAAAEKGGA